MRKGNWFDHPELVRTREKYHKHKVSAEEVAEIKSEIENQKQVEPVVRVVEDESFKSCMRAHSFKPAMSFHVRQNVIPILSETRKPRVP